MARCGCNNTSCACSVAPLDSETIDMSVVGNGAPETPYLVSGEVILVEDGEGPLSGENALKADALGLYVEPAANATILTTPSAYRTNSAGADVSLSAGISTKITEAFLDFEDHADAGIAWENANDGYRLTNAGLYELSVWWIIASSANTTGQALCQINGAAGDIVLQSNPAAYRGINTELFLPATVYCAAGSLITFFVTSSVTLNLTYGEVSVARRL